jgi:adenylyl-sulfate kinase
VSVAPRSPEVTWHRGRITRRRRFAALGQRGATMWFTGLPSSGKSTIAAAVEDRLVSQGRSAYLLDGDNLRHGLNGDLGFSAADRSENVRRAGHVALLLADAGLVALVSLISPYAEDRERVRATHLEAGLPFLEAYVNTPLEECERRDPKGLYARARAGALRGFTGVDDPYEPPRSPELELTPECRLDESVAAVLAALPAAGLEA